MFFGFSLPFGRWFGVPIRLSFWLLLTYVFLFIDATRGVGLPDILFSAAALTAMLICHEFGHRICAMQVGGAYNEFLLWPFGGMNHPTAPPNPAARLLAHGGGILANLAIAALCVAGVAILGSRVEFSFWSMNPLAAFFSGTPVAADVLHSAVLALQILFVVNMQLAMVNLLPFYWFDGGYLLEALLSPVAGAYGATNITCIVGMVVAVPLFLFCLMGKSLLGMAVCALLFAGSFNKRRELKAAGPAGMGSGFDYAAAAFATADEPVRRKRRWSGKSAVKKAAQARRDQEQIDAILAKVHAKGMQSLNWMEKRALRKATERQRNR